MRRGTGQAWVALLLCLALLPSGASAQTACAPLSDGQLIAQVIGAPLRGPTPDTAATTLAREHAGTVVLLGAAIESAGQVRGLVDALDAAAPAGLPPLIAVDEEGGRVARFGRSGVATHLPSARRMAATMTSGEVQVAAEDLGRQMAALGVDWDLAPVLDMTDADAGTVIGDRSFSSDPEVAGSYATAFAAGLQQAGLVTNGKHFPDHGLTAIDTHRAVAHVDVSRQAILDHHLRPYRQALPHLDSIMLSHLRVSSLDPDLPATLSAAAVDMVRSALDFDGAIVTDDLSMQAVASVADQPTAALMALQAGVDVLLVGTPEAAASVHARLSHALADGDLPRERLRQAARRALALKQVAGARASCLLGLPDVAESSGLLDSDGMLWHVAEGRRHAVPDPETARTYGVVGVRYSDEERDSLPIGPSIASVRRFQPLTVGPPGTDPAELAIARAAAHHGQGFVPGLVLTTAPDPWGAAIAAGMSEGGLPIVPTADTAQQQRAVDMTVPEARIRVVGTTEADGGGRELVPIDGEPVAAGLAGFGERRRSRGAPAEILVLAVEADEDVVAALLPWLSRPGTALLLTSGASLDGRVADALVEHGDAAVLTVGLSPAARSAVDAAPAEREIRHLAAEASAVADHLHREHGWMRIALHDGVVHVLSGLPLLGEVSAIPVRVGPDRPADGLVRSLASWRLPPSATRLAYGFGVDASAHLDLGLPTHHSRR